MAEVIVKLVRYDTEKTKKRKRADFTVTAQTEYSVIEKLEKIHKNDPIVAVHEIIWGEVVSVPQKNDHLLPLITGVVKFFSTDKGFGFIAPDEEMDDLFFHVSALGGQIIQQDDRVEFELSQGPKGVIAIRIKLIND